MKSIRYVLIMSLIIGIVWPLYQYTAEASDATSTLRILEIQPLRDFEITEDLFIRYRDTHTIQIDQMSMRQFIGTSNEINGNYDVIYIGNKTDGDGYTVRGEVFPSDQSLPQGGTQGLEYYSANDITLKQGSKIKEFIESEQLCIINSSVLENTETHLYDLINPLKARDNVILIEDIDTYFDYSYARPKGLLGKYYNTTSQEARNQSVTRIDNTINFVWGAGSPIQDIEADRFQVEWTGKIQPQFSENYTLYITCDDGARLWINGSKVLDEWWDHDTREFQVQYEFQAGRFYDIRLEFYENYGHADIKFEWQSSSQPRQIIPNNRLFLPEYRGLKGEYYNYSGTTSNIDFSGQMEQRLDHVLNFGWWRNKIHPNLNNDRVAARWTGKIIPKYSETYTFYTQTDDGVRLWVNGEQLVNSWQLQWNGQHEGTIDLVAGQVYDITMEYFEYYGEAQARLRWSSPSQTKEIIPYEALLLPSGGAAGNPKNFYYDYSTIDKRPLLVLTDKPITYTGPSHTVLEDGLLNFLFSSQRGNNLTARLLMDWNGDGVYRESEEVKRLEGISSNHSYVINYRVGYDFSGILPWRLEIEDSNGRKDTKSGVVAIYSETQVIRVLQIVPPKNRLSLNSLSSVNGENLLIKEGSHRFEITEVPLDAFERYPNSYNNKPTELNSNYDMVVLGFSDSYGSSDIKSEAARQALSNFESTGQGIIFTHDTMSFRVNSSNSFAYELTKSFRNLLGQNIYSDEELDLSNPSYGFTDITLKPSLQMRTNRIKAVNKGSIQIYPYVIDSDQIGTTHYQYFQLDMEADDLIPWYNMGVKNTVDPYDSRNAYYLYTKGNMTFAGMGHGNLNTNEKKLLVNTMYTAYGLANHAPEIQWATPDTYENIGDKTIIPIEVLARDDGEVNQNLTGRILANNSEVSRFILKPGELKSLEVTISNMSNQAVDLRLEVADQDGAMSIESKLVTSGANQLPISIAEDRRGNLDIEVLDASHGPISNVTLQVTKPDGNVITGETNSHGIYSLTDVELGLYTIDVLTATFGVGESQRQIALSPVYNQQHITYNVGGAPFYSLQREVDTDVRLGEPFQVTYTAQGDILSYPSQFSGELPFQQLLFDEAFPPGMQIISYPDSLVKTGDMDTGYRLTGAVDAFSFQTKQWGSNGYQVMGEFTIQLQVDNPGSFTLNQGSIRYHDAYTMSGENIYGTADITFIQIPMPSFLQVPEHQTNGAVLLELIPGEEGQGLLYKIGNQGTWTTYTEQLIINHNTIIYGKSLSGNGQESAVVAHEINNINKSCSNMVWISGNNVILRIGISSLQAEFTLNKDMYGLNFHINAQGNGMEIDEYGIDSMIFVEDAHGARYNLEEYQEDKYNLNGLISQGQYRLVIPIWSNYNQALIDESIEVTIEAFRESSDNYWTQIEENTMERVIPLVELPTLQ